MRYKYLPSFRGAALLLLLAAASCQRANVTSTTAGAAIGTETAKTGVTTSASTFNIAIFTGGDPSTTSTLYPDMKAGSFTTVVLWAAHIDTAGNVNFNDSNVVKNGSWVSTPANNAWLSGVQSLKVSPSTINRVELSIGGEASSFANIETLINEYGTGSNSPLYKSMSLLHTQLGLDAIDYDDESQYNAASSEAFAQVCINIGMKVTICPYTNTSYWVSLVTAINKIKAGSSDQIYLQCYDGGASNNPATWNSSFSSTGVKVCPGLWANHGSTCSGGSTPAQVESQFKTWEKASTLAGGFMYNGNEMEGCPAAGDPAQYATALKNGL